MEKDVSVLRLAGMELCVDIGSCGFVVWLMGKRIQKKSCVDVGCCKVVCKSWLLWIRGLLDGEEDTEEVVRGCRLL
jgi:hypothetical protein